MAPDKMPISARKMPFVWRAWIPEAKLRDYVLCADHARGKHKARVFAAVLGILQDDWRYLHDQILARLNDARVHKVAVAPPYGLEYDLRLLVDGRNEESAVVRTLWMVDATHRPRLTSAWVDLD